MYARRYCFKATVPMLDGLTKHRIGTFTAFGRTPYVAKAVEQACLTRIGQRDATLPNTVTECGDVVLVMLLECPVEATEEVSFAFDSLDDQTTKTTKTTNDQDDHCE